MITHTWINTNELASGIEKYYPVFRILSKTLPVEIVRNKFDSTSGVYVIGDEKFMHQVKNAITEIITKIEKKANKKIFKTGIIHISSQRSRLKSQLALEVSQTFEREMIKERANLSKNDLWEEKKQRELCKLYIQETPSLRILKPFK